MLADREAAFSGNWFMAATSPTPRSSAAEGPAESGTSCSPSSSVMK